jgi:hypothetical protein
MVQKTSTDLVLSTSARSDLRLEEGGGRLLPSDAR